MSAEPQRLRTLRIMLVDDHEVVRKGVRALLEPAQDMRLVAEASSVAEAITTAERVAPDVIVMDIRLADGSGIDATREIRARQPNVQVLVLTSFADDQAVFASIMAGAAGYVLKEVTGTELLHAIRAVGRGGNLLDPAITKVVLDRMRKNSRVLRDERLNRLTAQEEQILEMIAAGRTNREIGEKLGLAEKTVRNYVSTIFDKLNVARRAEAAAYLATRRMSLPERDTRL